MTAIEKKSLKVGKYVDTAHVDTVIREYKQTRWVHNSERMGKEDSLSAWYSIEELEEFIHQCKKQGGDGIRLYFGAYPENYVEIPEYAGRQTFVLVATKSKTTLDGIKNKDIYIGTGNGSTILAYNSPYICPPRCSSGKSGSDDNDWGGIGITIVDYGDKGSVIV